MAWLAVTALYTFASFLHGKVSAALRERSDDTRPRPSGVDDVEAPTVEEGSAVPVIWGTCLLQAANVLWYGDLRSMETAYGYRYFLNVMYAFCHGPVDAVVSLRWDDYVIPVCELPNGPPPYEDIEVIPYPIERSSNPLEVWVYGPQQFGGDEKEGGVEGKYRLYWGTDGQRTDGYLADFLDVDLEDFPAYRGLCFGLTLHSYFYPGTLGDRPFYIGTSTYLKPHAIVARRCPNQLGLTGDRHNIDGDANPACMVYELLTDDRWGIGLPASMIDIDALRTVGSTLYAEGFGLSMRQMGTTDGRKIIDEICRHVDAVVGPDLTTGLITMTLIRDDYDPDDLVEIDDDSILELVEFSRPDADSLANRVAVTYTDRDQQYQEKVALAVDLAGVQSLGGIVSQDMSFPGISNAALAQKVAARELKTVSYPFAALRIKVNRAGWSLRPGRPFKFSSSRLGISGMVCRVTRISFGAITDGAISIEATEDAFGVSWTAYSPPAASQWTEPIEVPEE